MADHYQQQQQQAAGGGPQHALLFGAGASSKQGKGPAGAAAAAGGRQQQQQQQRVIVHIDMDCFFAAVSTVGRPEFAGGWTAALLCTRCRHPACCFTLPAVITRCPGLCYALLPRNVAVLVCCVVFDAILPSLCLPPAPLPSPLFASSPPPSSQASPWRCATRPVLRAVERCLQQTTRRARLVSRRGR